MTLYIKNGHRSFTLDLELTPSPILVINQNDSTTIGTGEEDMNMDEQQIIELYRAVNQAMVAKDIDKLDRILRTYASGPRDRK